MESGNFVHILFIYFLTKYVCGFMVDSKIKVRGIKMLSSAATIGRQDADSSDAGVSGSVESHPISQADENMLLSRRLAKARCQLVEQLSLLPVSALWILTKHGQKKNDCGQEASEDLEPLAELGRSFQKASIKACESLSGSAFKQEYQKLQWTLQNFSLKGEEIQALCELLLAGTKGAPLQRLPQLRHYCNEFLFPPEIFDHAYLACLDGCYRQWKDSRESFARHNVGLVYLLQQQYSGEVMSAEDLRQEGMVGLLKAVDRFDHRLGFKFSTYASYWIRQAMSRSLTRNERVVRLPFAQMALIQQLCQARETLLAKNGSEPSQAMLAKEMDICVAELVDLQAISQNSLSLDESFDDEDNANLLQFQQQDCHASAFKNQADRQLRQIFVQSLSLLNPKERLVVCWRFGFNCSKELTLDEIGRQLDLTRERVRQIQVSALEKIKSRYGDQLQHFLA